MLHIYHFLPRREKNEEMEHIFIDKYIFRKMAATPKTLSLLQEITDNQWSIILKQLIVYAELRLTKIGFKPRTEIDSVRGEDFAMEAIKKLFEGKRNWDPSKHPDLLIHLKLVVKSLIWNHIKSSMKSIVDTQEQSHAKTEKDSDNTAEPDDTNDPDMVIEQANQENPLEIVISQERWNKIEAAFEEDADGFIIFCDWLDDLPPRLIAEKYNIDVTVVYNIVKKGKRIITKIYAY
jgi:hypothetical protein